MSPENVPYTVRLMERFANGETVVLDEWSDNGIGGGDCVPPYTVEYTECPHFTLLVYAFIANRTLQVTLGPYQVEGCIVF
jgi:hypothetical protein